MDISEYVTHARSTAIYPNLGDNYIYPVLGLNGEAGELAEKIVMSRTAKKDKLSDLNKEIVKEIGDVMWYVANVSKELDLNLELKELEILSITDISMLMCARAARVAEKAKKAIRDKEGNLDNGDIAVIQEQLNEIVSLVDALAKLIGSSLEEVCTVNIEKLFSRKARNALQGEGDNR